MAVRITLKRSSILNKRPNADLLDPGELALNTNALSPGLFFETDDNSVVKAGPAFVGVEPPTLTPSLGEEFYNSITNSLSIGDLDLETAEKVWREVSGPYLGGTNGYVVFVAPEFPTSNDSILNDGQSAPYKTINRAVIEIAKQSIVRANESDEFENNRYTICVQPGTNPVYNQPGRPINIVNDLNDEVDYFDVNFDLNPDASPEILAQFNSEIGGLLLPRGTSIQGVDLRKTIIRPTYVPDFEVPGGGGGQNDPRTSIIRWTGNSYVHNLTFKDKETEILVKSFSQYKDSSSGVFHSIQPHGLCLNDVVTLNFTAAAERATATSVTFPALSGKYYAFPIGVDTFLLSYIPISNTDANYIERNQLPPNNQGIAYLATVTWNAYSHHRLSVIGNSTIEELNTFYSKVQLAFPSYFEGKVNQAEVINPGETQIVAPVSSSDLLSLAANQNENGSPYAFNSSVRSSYGLCGVFHNADLFTGFKSILVSQFTVASIQNDPYVYEVYSTIFDEDTQKSYTGWFPLAAAAWNAIAAERRPPSPWLVPKAELMEYLNQTPVINIRYSYKSLTSADGKTYGLVDPETDCRHFGFKATNRGYAQIDTGWTIGTAIGFWGQNGAQITVTNSSSNFGSVAIRTEGFAGLGSLGGALPQDQGFTFAGIRMPQKLTPYTVNEFNVYSLGASVLSVVSDPVTQIQTVTLGAGFEPITLLPYSLEPNTAIWMENGTDVYRGFFVDDGLPTTIFLPNGNCELRLRAQDTSIPDAPLGTTSLWEPPYIKRFQDPRTVGQQSYSLVLENTQPGHRDPMVGHILRLQQTSSNNNQALTIRPGVQLDPGPTGGWGRVFQVAFSQTSTDGDAPQYNETLLNRPLGAFYYTALAALDNSRPWLEDDQKPHGAYVTFQNRNWYATCNDQWRRVYYSNDGKPVEGEKLLPTAYNSPYANTYCIENQYEVKDTYQGQFGGDPEENLYQDGTYFRGDSPIRSNYDFSDYFNQDNGTTNFGLVRYNDPLGLATDTTVNLEPESTTIQVANVNQFSSVANPKKSFVVMSLVDPNDSSRIEYVQVIAYNVGFNTMTVIRGVYGTKQDSDWESGTTVRLQGPAEVILPQEYDYDWAPSKYAMIRLLQVMGYTKEAIDSILVPTVPSSRNLFVADMAIQPKEGYAVNTGPWGFEFNLPTTVNCTFHQFHSVGYFDYSRGLPRYLKSNINAKQYYDFVSSILWGGFLTLFGQNENGQTMLEGDFTQALTGRPYGSMSSDITNFPRKKADTRDDGDEQTYVRLVDTGEGLTGGPITDIGVIALLPATSGGIGGVFPGDGLLVTAGGQLNLDRSGVGTVNSVTAGIGLGAPNTGDSITNTGTLNLLPPTSTTLGGVIAGEGVEISISGVLGLKPATTGTLGGVIPGTGVSVSATGALSILPPSGDVIGGVKAGKGINIDPDGTISIPDGPSGVLLLDQLGFNGTTTIFQLTSGGQPVVPSATQYTLIAIGGVVQGTPDAYTVSGSTITFTSAPPSGASFYGIVFG
jgi:hypothetical protein